MQLLRIMLLFGGLLIVGNEGVGQVKRNNVSADLVKVPIAGNSWQTGGLSDERDFISEEGIKRWDNVDKGFKTFVRLGQTGTLSVWLNAKVNKASSLTVTVAGLSEEVNLPIKGDTVIHLGDWDIRDTGYISIDLKGKPVHLTDIHFLGLSGTAVSERTHFVKNNEGNFFYWGRRGPSTHLNYQVPEGKDIAYYYNEVTVPEGNDVIGSYFMADGFTGGYFGMQVNSLTERRILFSVWSPFQTDDPKAIPPDHQIKLIKKGEGVHTGEFGNEGAGGQSYFKFGWKAGTTYRFLLKGEPVANKYTNYTAWFFAPELGRWKLIASFSRPQTSSWLKGFHSFLENFSPQQGIFERKVYFGNQWVCDREGNWYEIDKARFSADNTARVGYRLDYSGGSEEKQFFLRNFGFFNDYTPIGSVFHRSAGGVKPPVEFNELP